MRVRAGAWRVGAALLAACGAASAAPAGLPVRTLPPGLATPEPPLPPVRPHDGFPVKRGARTLPPVPREVFGPPLPPLPLVAPVAGAVPLEDELACVRLLTSRKVEARAAPPPPPSPAGCLLPAPIEIAAVLLVDGRRVPLQPAVTVACPFGAAFADWVRDDLAPAFEHAGTPLASLVSTSGYACRGRNGVVGAKLSEHARGDAVDVGGFKARDGTVTGVKQAGTPLLAAVKATACSRFSTVLGPGSDGFHEQHMHVDLAQRRHGAKLCQWDLPSAPRADGRAVPPP